LCSYINGPETDARCGQGELGDGSDDGRGQAQPSSFLGEKVIQVDLNP
jgi:hypothetical protein